MAIQPEAMSGDQTSLINIKLGDLWISVWPFSKMVAENSNKSKKKLKNWKIYRRLYDWGYNAYPQLYKPL